MKVRYADALNIVFLTGALPDPGGVQDQEAPFADALVIVAAAQAEAARRRAKDGG